MTKAEISDIIYKRIIKRIVLKALALKLDEPASPTNGADKKFGEKLFTFSENRDIIKEGIVEKFDPDQPRDENGRFTSPGGSSSSDSSSGGEIKSASGYTKDDFSKAVVGLKTGDGIKIKRCSVHAFDRVIERDIWPKSIIAALKNKSIPSRDGRVEYIDNKTHVIVDNKAGVVITAIYKKGKGK